MGVSNNSIHPWARLMWNQFKRQIWQWRGILIMAPSITLLVMALRGVGLLELLEMAALDQFFRLRPQEEVDSRILIVEMNESDVQQLGWPVSDGTFARLINNLKKHEPIGIGLDFYRDKPVLSGYQEFTQICGGNLQPERCIQTLKAGHQEFVKVLESTPNLIGVQKVVESTDSSAVSPSPILKARDQIGANDFPLDRDGKVRRGLIFLAEKDGSSIFSFAWKLTNLYLEAKGVQASLTEDNQVKVGSTILPRFRAHDGGYIRADDGGYHFLLNYRGSMNSFPTVSMTDALENRVSPELIRGRIVLIGPTAESLKDLFYTPYSSSLTRETRRMPGVAIHANGISHILSASLDGRPLIRTWDEPWEWLWLLSWALLGACLTWQQRNIRETQRIPWPTGGILVAAIALIGGSYSTFLAGWWIPVVPALLALTGSAIAVTAYIARSAGEIRKAFGRFVTNEIVANLLENPEGLKLGGERRKITILTSDIRGFTAISERLPPEEVIKIINLYLGYMADVITQYQGTIDEFMGDGILVLFGAPTIREDDAERAIACALAMQLAMQPVNERMQELGLPKLEMGIGINTGEVVVGNIGSEKRTKYGIVGDQVNLTYRIEGYTVGGQVFVTESTLEEVQSDVITDEQREVQPKGVHKPIMIYEVIGLLGKYNLHLIKQEETFLPLPTTIAIQYATLDGKQINRDIVKGKLVSLSAREAEVYLEETDLTPAPLTNLKLNIYLNDEATGDEDVYAKVLEKPAKANHFYIRFTNRPPTIEARLNELYQSLSAQD